MADPKKPDKKSDKPAPAKTDPFRGNRHMDFCCFFLAIYLLNGFLGMFASNGLFSRGWQGLTPQGIILSHTEAVNALLNPIGSRVISTGNKFLFTIFPAGK